VSPESFHTPAEHCTPRIFPNPLINFRNNEFRLLQFQALISRNFYHTVCEKDLNISSFKVCEPLAISKFNLFLKTKNELIPFYFV